LEVRGELYALANSSPGTHWTGGWVGPRTGLENVERRKVNDLKTALYPMKWAEWRRMRKIMGMLAVNMTVRMK
jgi:hypothetical protein